MRRPVPARGAVIRFAACILVTALLACAGRPAGDDAPLRIVVLSDLNSAYGSTEYEPEVSAAVTLVTEEWQPDVVLIAGDMIAGQRPSLGDEQVRAMWAAFDSVVAAPLRAADIPFAFTLGNHDASGHPAHGRDRRLARAYWTQPAHALSLEMVDDGHFPFSYAFSIGDAFVLVLDASTGAVAADSAQLAWVRRTLASEAARSARVRIALGHVPLYAVAEGRNRVGEVQAEPDSVRAVLERGGVAMYIAGHHHAYYPGYRGSLLLLSTGALGQGPRPLLDSSMPPYKSITLLELHASGEIVDRTYRVDSGRRVAPVDRNALPARIDGVNGYVLRADPSGP